MSASVSWDRFRERLCRVPDLGMTLDLSRMNIEPDLFDRMNGPMEAAISAMGALEAGGLANPDEQRRVGHYWLRDPDRAPEPAMADAIRRCVAELQQFAGDVHRGAIHPPNADGFYLALTIGMGGSILGPQLLDDALRTPEDPVLLRFIDNTDPAGLCRVFAELDDSLAQTLTIISSKSGGTVETRNAMREAEAAYRRLGLDFARHAVAVTCEGSTLDREAQQQRFLRVFPMWDWVGGRTSVTSAVGLLPAGLQGIDTEAFLAGARACDAATRARPWQQNPAALLALAWLAAGEGRGRRSMVVLPYADQLGLLGRYLQQLVMESLGKARDRAGREVHQGLTVYGNKGTSDQHAYLQQLLEGPDDFFVSFVRVLQQPDPEGVFVEEEITSGDYLSAFWLGSRQALTDAGRQSLTLTLPDIDARSMGALIALFERAVGLYAEVINVNAYHQPAVESQKRAARRIIDLQRAVMALLRGSGEPLSAASIAARLDQPDATEDVFHVLEHLGACTGRGVRKLGSGDEDSVGFEFREVKGRRPQ